MMEYPVVMVSEHGGLSFAKSEDDLLRCSLKAWEKGFYTNLRIVDHSAMLYTVHHADKVGWDGPLFGFSLLYRRRIRVQLVIAQPCEAIGLEAFRRLMMKTLFSYAGYSSAGFTEAELGALASSKPTIGALIDALAEEYFKDTRMLAS